jgi:hypothetical protein
LGIRLKRRAAKYGTEIRCNVALDIWEKLRRMAGNRGLSVSQFSRLLIEVAVDEGLVTKILDEARPRKRRRRPPDAPRIGRPRRRAVAAGAPVSCGT